MLNHSPRRLAGTLPVFHESLALDALRPMAIEVRERGGRLVSLWGESGACLGLNVVWLLAEGFIWHQYPLTSRDYPALDDVFPNASRMQRATFDMVGLRALGAQDCRPWWRHEAWPKDAFPLMSEVTALEADEEGMGYPFVTVGGEGVHEIPVGPVHAGIIEPGHFRFSVVGERVLRLDTQLGYTHKGVEKLAQGLDAHGLVRLGGRLSGDSTVAGAWAAAQALESALGLIVPARAEWLRALWLERERVINHLGDLAYLCNDVGLASGFSLFWALKERALRSHAQWTGARYLRDRVVLGGVAEDLTATALSALMQEGNFLEQETVRLEHLLQEHAGVQDRVMTTGRVAPELAARFGMIGLAGRASSQAWDLRVTMPTAPYASAEVQMALRHEGDVAARMALRFDEIRESLRLIRHFLLQLPEGSVRLDWDGAARSGLGLGCVEGWRGEVMVALVLKDDGTVARWHPEEASMSNWPLLEHGVLGNIVADFPLINKSFNFSYSGQDG